MKTEWMWEGRCISDARGADLCKEAGELYLHEQLVVRRVRNYYFRKRKERKGSPIHLGSSIINFQVCGKEEFRGRFQLTLSQKHTGVYGKSLFWKEHEIILYVVITSLSEDERDVKYLK